MLEVLQDLGTRNQSPNSMHKARFYLVKCSRCNREWETRRSIWNRRKNGYCQPCSVSIANTIHGDSHSRLYCIWNKMKARCFDTKQSGYEAYGSMGISVCNQWMDYILFRKWAKENGYSNNLTIDRINNMLGYSPDNCRWVSNSIQAANKIKSHGIIPYIGVIKGKRTGTFVARVYYEGKVYLRKTFDSVEIAVNERNRVIKENKLPHNIQEYAHGLD